MEITRWNAPPQASGPSIDGLAEHQVVLPRRREPFLPHGPGDLGPMPDFVEWEVERELPFRDRDLAGHRREGELLLPSRTVERAGGRSEGGTGAAPRSEELRRGPSRG